MRESEEIEYIKAARAVGIPSVVGVLSWDNLTTKGLFHVLPDLVLVWNRTQQEEAVRIHGIPAERAVITGSPFFDKWFDAERLLMDRDAFCRRVGLESRRPFLLYLGSTSNIAADETWLVSELARRMREHPDPEVRDTAILARPHPQNAAV